MHVLLQADQRPNQIHKDVRFCQLIRKKPYLWEERTWTDIEPQDYSLNDYPVSKQLINLLRHGSLLREDDGAIEFWRHKRLSPESFCAFSTLV